MMPMPYGQSTNQPTTGGNSLSTSSTDTNTITKEHIRLSLLSAVEDKIKARSKEMLSQYKAEIDVLKRTSNYFLNQNFFSISSFMIKYSR